MRRKKRFDTFKEAQSRGSYDEFPMLELGIDPQVHLSRNTVDQPFFLICEKDTVLAQVAGSARVEFRKSSVNYFNLELGDFVYVPGGTPHRILPKTESVHLRYKAEHPGLEAVAWYSERDGDEIARVTWDCADELPQEGYLRACLAFNETAALPIDLSPFHWAEVAAEIRETEAAERARPGAGNDEAFAPAPRSRMTTIAPPNDAKEPLKNNVYLFARVATTALNPLFPYTEPGAIVPCVTLQDPATRGPMGYFVHWNTVHEVNISFGTRGSFQAPGVCGAGPIRHGVGQKPGQTISEMINLAVITQRQAESGKQRESLGFVCDQCETVLFENEFDSHSFPEPLQGEVNRALIGLPVTSHDAVLVEAFNRDESLRTCKKCGHVNPPFPGEYWGWQEYRRRTHVVAEAREIMKTAGTGALVS